MKQIYNSDKPILKKEQDRFNRYKFSNRIAETIIKRNDSDGLVIGLYGIWGEGKSSVLNMIEDDLKLADDVLIVKFNPWRFKDEDSLILNFLKNISEILDKELENKKEKVAKFLKKYGAIVSVLNIDLSKLGESLSDTQLEDLKIRVNDFLKESEKKIVVIIDDIDRLDKQELFSLFKLIKLTGDFSKTYYILSFDDEMVASAIGERFAEGNRNSGYNFLEKIIQVPLRIPQALPKELLTYTFELINSVLAENQIDLDDNEGQKLGQLLSQSVLIKIKTPRLALRYANSISFLIPLMKGEVNISDLILLEAVKIFYPKFYEFIKNAPEYFIETYYDYDDKKNANKAQEFKDHFEDLNKSLTKNEQKSIRNLLKQLFPYIKEGLDNVNLKYGKNDWAKEKRIVSNKYFNRYFIYSVPTDDISDIYFDNYISTLETKKYSEISKETNEILEKNGLEEYLFRIGFYEETLSWESRKIVIHFLCENQEKFEGVKGGTFMNFFNPKTQAATAISRLLSKHPIYSEKLELGKKLMSNEVNFEFSTELLRWFNVGNAEEDKTFNNSDLKLLGKLILQRALNDSIANQDNIFNRYENYIFRLLEYWQEDNKEELSKYIKDLLKLNPKLIGEIIYSLTGTIYSSSVPLPYKVDFKKESFELLKEIYDVGELYKILMKNFKKEIGEDKAVFFDHDQGQTKINSFRQFIHWYNLDKEANSNDN